MSSVAESHLSGALEALELPMLPVFEEQLRPQLLLAVSVTWAGLLGAASCVELQPLLAAVSRQLQHCPCWQQRFPPLEDTKAHKAFAESVLKELGQVTTAAMAQKASPLEVPEFEGSEWLRPLRGGELEQLLLLAYALAQRLDWALGRPPRLTARGPVPQTEWPRMLGNWKFSLLLSLALLFAALW